MFVASLNFSEADERKVRVKMALSDNKRKKGCPTCDGVDAKSCMRCRGKTRMCDWHFVKDDKTGAMCWMHISQISEPQRKHLDVE